MSESFEAREERRDKMEVLKERGIVSFDVHVTHEEQEAIREVSIQKELGQFSYYGPVDESFISRLKTHLGELDGNTSRVIDSLSSLITRVAINLQQSFSQEAAFVLVRVVLPNDHFVIPRWHQDGHYVQDASEEEYKLVFTVKGPQTRFAEIVDFEKFQRCILEDAENVRLHEYDLDVYEQEDLRIRKALASTVSESEPLREGCATMYRVGSSDARVHSEPHIKEPRIFMSVVAGSLDQIEKLRQRYEQ